MKIHLNKIFLFVILAASALSVRAAEVNFIYPVPELGNCASKIACRTYCDKPENISVCTDFALKHKLVSPVAAEKAKRLAAVLREGGPGGCKTETTCRTYCARVQNIEECANVAQKAGLLSRGAAEQVRDVAPLLQSRNTPGKCTTVASCREYCEQPEHRTECVEFIGRLIKIHNDPEPTRTLAPKRSPALTPTPRKIESKSPEPTRFPPEMLRGGPTNQPEAVISTPRKVSYRRSWLGSLMSALLSW